MHQQLQAEGLPGIECVYTLIWPDYPPHIQNHPRDNRLELSAWRQASGIPVWAWLNAQPDQAQDAEDIQELDTLINPDGWLLDIEGPWTKGAKLKTLLDGVPKHKPRRASLAGTSANHVEYDYRELDRQGFDVEWQAYFNSGEGPWPADAVREMYQADFVITGQEYRHRVGDRYGWGRVKLVQHQELAVFDSYLRPGQEDSVFGVIPRSWGWTVDDRILWPANPDKPPIGLLMGRVAYPRIRIALNMTRPSGITVTWDSAAQSARLPGARKRPLSIYTAENTTDAVVLEVARAGA